MYKHEITILIYFRLFNRFQNNIILKKKTNIVHIFSSEINSLVYCNHIGSHQTRKISMQKKKIYIIFRDSNGKFWND